MANVKKIAAVSVGLAVLGAFWKKTQAEVIVNKPTSVHEFDIAISGIDPEAKKFLLAAVRKNLGDRIPIAGIVTNVQVQRGMFRGMRWTTWRVTYKYDNDLSVKLLGLVESGLDPHHFHIRQVDTEHYRALPGYDDIGIFQISRHYYHSIDWDYFTVEDYIQQAKIVIDTLKDGKQWSQIIGGTLHQWGKLPDETTPEASEYFALAIYHELWNRKASPGSRNARNFLRKYRQVIGEANQLKELKLTYTINIGG